MLVPHFQVVNEFVLAYFAALIFHRLHGDAHCSLSTNSANILTPLSLANVALRLICGNWPFIKVWGWKSMPLIIMQGVLISIIFVARIIWLTLSLTWPNVTWLKLSLIVRSLPSVRCVNLIQVFIEPLLALQACQVPCSILILRYAVLGNCTCTSLSTILPIALWKQINTEFVNFLSSSRIWNSLWKKYRSFQEEICT